MRESVATKQISLMRIPRALARAADARGGKQFCKLFFRGSALERHTIQQQLRTARAEQQTCIGCVWNGRAQFLPGTIELLDRADMVIPVQTGKLQENVQASDEGPCCGRFGVDCLHMSQWDYLPSTVALWKVGGNGTEVPCAPRVTRLKNGGKTCSEVQYGTLEGQVY
jgi:hypothetical protein